MTVVRADFYSLFRRLTSAMGAGSSSSFTTVLDDPRRSAGEFFTSIQAADDEVCTLICESEGHGFRPLFLSTTGDLAHGSTLPDRIGPITQVKITTGGNEAAGIFDKNLSLADIERWRRNTESLYGPDHDTAGSSLGGYYIQLGDEIFFTGSSAKAKMATYARISRDVTDGAMVSPTKVLTGTLLATATDAGAGVLVEGAGASGVPLVSRVDVFTDASTVTLRDANASGGSITGKTVTIAKLQSPQNYEDAVLAIAVMNQVKRGDTVQFLSEWKQAANAYRGWIGSGRVTVPSLEMAQAA